MSLIKVTLISGEQYAVVDDRPLEKIGKVLEKSGCWRTFRKEGNGDDAGNEMLFLRGSVLTLEKMPPEIRVGIRRKVHDHRNLLSTLPLRE